MVAMRGKINDDGRDSASTAWAYLGGRPVWDGWIRMSSMMRGRVHTLLPVSVSMNSAFL